MVTAAPRTTTVSTHIRQKYIDMELIPVIALESQKIIPSRSDRARAGGNLLISHGCAIILGL